MRAFIRILASTLLGMGLMAMAGQALACNCTPPSPPTPPHNPRPPHVGCTASCGGGGHHGGGGDINVNVNVKASANASVTAGSSAGASAGSVSYGGGYGNWSQTPGYPQEVGALNVVAADDARFESYSETQAFTRQVVIEANCIDDTGVPHPASQVFPDRAIAPDYKGEIYRCIAGTHMQWIYADYDGSHVSFDHGQTNSCQKGEALWHEGGKLSCRAQIQERQCNERSLLRRFGAGIKTLSLTRTETVTKQRQVATLSVQRSVMTFDGGVGGFVQ